MITVLHVITGLNTGGAEMTLAKLVERSNSTRLRHVVVSLKEPGSIGQRIAEHGVPVLTLGMASGVTRPGAFIRLVATLRREAPNVVQTWLYHADLLGLLAAKPLRIPVIWNLRSSSPLTDLRPSTARVAHACARLSRFPNAVVTNSEAAKGMHARLGYRPKEWLVIPNGFDVDRFAPDAAAYADVRLELGLPANTILIGLIARHDPLKDHATFLRAAGMPRTVPEPHFVLVGSGVTHENAPLRELIANEGIGNRVHLLGERTDIPRLTAALDIATSSSSGESFSNVIGEAMACTVPCVVTDVGDSATIVGETGRVVPSRDAAALATAWQELIDLGSICRQALGRQARARISARYGLDSVVSRYEELYERMARET